MKNYLVDETSQGAAEGLSDQVEDPQDRLQDLRVGDLLEDPVLAEGLGTVKPNGSHENTSVNSQTTQLNKTNTTTLQYVIKTRIPVEFIVLFIYQSTKIIANEPLFPACWQIYCSWNLQAAFTFKAMCSVTTDVDLQVILNTKSSEW